MSVAGLNHINITATQPLIGQVRDFYVDVLGLEEGDRPDFGVPGYWLYAGGQPVVHLLDSSSWSEGETCPQAPDYLDHIAFTCTNVDATEARLTGLGYEVKRRDFSVSGFIQLFLHDPSGLGVELNFAV